MSRSTAVAIAVAFAVFGRIALSDPIAAQTFTVSFPAATSATPLDGRMMLLLSNDPGPDGKTEPRMQISDGINSQQVFGITVDALAPGHPVTFTNDAEGYPHLSLRDVPAGDYTLQAVLNIYQTYHLATGHTVKLAADRGEGHHWESAPGNLYSKPVKVHIGSKTDRGKAISVSLDQTIPPIPPIADNKYIRHIRVADEVLGNAHVPLRRRARS